MAQALTRAGFEQVRRCAFGDSEDPAFRAVEDPNRFADPGVGPECAMEARRARIPA